MPPRLIIKQKFKKNNNSKFEMANKKTKYTILNNEKSEM